ncbi:hypothetical protein RC74_15960 [Falsihalocynthiibacter arcticus]|uniref:Uncharacterized protein n=1 Tax=Falsihalocynthiibacter arcticus TaxID=1579316 RepID=A0A126V2L6_9RHOB|nr:hypothetical protein RC74_15960 [Falsihalocynthiibacter arcticus]
MAAGPPSQRCMHRLPGSGWFPPTKSHSAYRTASVLDKARGVLVFGLTKFHHFIGLANSYCCFVGPLNGSRFVGLIPCQHSPDHTGSFVGHGNGGHSAGLFSAQMSAFREPFKNGRFWKSV